jgi:hypothetical protein
MANGNTNPLSENHYQQIMAGLESADAAIRQAEMAQQAGLDVASKLKAAQDAKAQLLRLKNTYFPGR